MKTLGVRGACLLYACSRAQALRFKHVASSGGSGPDRACLEQTARRRVLRGGGGASPARIQRAPPTQSPVHHPKAPTLSSFPHSIRCKGSTTPTSSLNAAKKRGTSPAGRGGCRRQGIQADGPVPLAALARAERWPKACSPAKPKFNEHESFLVTARGARVWFSDDLATNMRENKHAARAECHYSPCSCNARKFLPLVTHRCFEVDLRRTIQGMMYRIDTADRSGVDQTARTAWPLSCMKQLSYRSKWSTVRARRGCPNKQLQREGGPKLQLAR